MDFDYHSGRATVGYVNLKLRGLLLNNVAIVLKDHLLLNNTLIKKTKEMTHLKLITNLRLCLVLPISAKHLK